MKDPSLQHGDMHEKDAVVVMTIADLEKLHSAAEDYPLNNSADGPNLGDLDLEREEDLGRDVLL